MFRPDFEENLHVKTTKKCLEEDKKDREKTRTQQQKLKIHVLTVK